MKNRKLIIGVTLGVGCLLCLIVGIFVGAPTPLESTPSAIPTDTPLPATPTATVVPASPTPEPGAQDAAYILGWMEKLEPLSALATGLLDDISEAVTDYEVGTMCTLVDGFLEACEDYQRELNGLPSPNHSYLIAADNHQRIGIEKWIAAATALQDFCADGDVTKLELATSLLDESIEEWNTATSWITKYTEETQR